MKLGKTVLAELVRIVQNGILAAEDVSEDLRQIDVVLEDVANPDSDLTLSPKYVTYLQRNN